MNMTVVNAHAKFCFYYFRDGADEIAILNITGFRDCPLSDLPMLDLLRRISENVFVPLTIGGGIRDFVDSNGVEYSALDIANAYFRYSHRMPPKL